MPTSPLLPTSLLQSALALAQAHPGGLHAEHLGYGYRRRPVRLEDAPANIQRLYNQAEAEVGWQGLARLTQMLLLPGGALITAGGQVISDSLVKANDLEGAEKLLALAQPAQARAAQMDTPAVVLTQGGAGNYGHWLADALPRLRWLPQSPAAGLPVYVQPANLKLAQLTAHLLPAPAPEFVAWPNKGLRLAELWFPARCNTGPRNHCIEGLAWLRQAAWAAHAPAALANLVEGAHSASSAKPSQHGGRRLYVSRDDSPTRQLLNDAQVWPLLQAQGFERIQCGALPFAQQVAMFAQAECIAGIAGAALANLIFAQPQARVLMLTPDNVPFLYYWDMVQHLQAPATWLFGPAADAAKGNHSDFSVDPARVQAWLSAL